jgi:hypothetical protein
MQTRTRRTFLEDIGRGMLVAGVGYGVASDLGFVSALGADAPERIDFGPMEPLVRLMQETPVNKLVPTLMDRVRAGTSLKDLVAAGALANARTFGGEDYTGFHTIMALAPAYHMSQEMPEGRQPLPVLKVLYRNTSRIHETGGVANEVLHPVRPAELSSGQDAGDAVREAVRTKNVDVAEGTFAALAKGSPEDLFNSLLHAVHDNTEVHRVVLPFRAFVLLDLVGAQHAHTMLRQSLRYCVRAEKGSRNTEWDRPRTLLPKLLEEHKLLGRKPGNRKADDAWVDQMSQTLFKVSADEAAAAAAAALAEGFEPDAIGEAISLAANQLVLRDVGRSAREEYTGKPIGSVHGDSIGVHASDSANAWRNMARFSNPRNAFACLILGAYQVALDRVNRGGDFQNWQPHPIATHLDRVKTTDPKALLAEAEEAIRGNLQARAAAIIHRYGELGHPHRGAFDLMLRYATSEDGALHAEKYYRTASEEFATTRPAFRWRQLVALARVTASECGRPAPGYDEACELLKVS